MKAESLPSSAVGQAQGPSEGENGLGRTLGLAGGTAKQ